MNWARARRSFAVPCYVGSAEPRAPWWAGYFFFLTRAEGGFEGVYVRKNCLLSVGVWPGSYLFIRSRMWVFGGLRNKQTNSDRSKRDQSLMATWRSIHKVG